MSSTVVFLEANATGTTFEAMQKARAWGCHLVFVTMDRPFYAALVDNPLELAHEVVDCDTYDPVAVLRALGGIAVDAIVSFDDYHLPVAALCAMALGLPHADVNSLMAARYKDLMRQRLAGLPGAVRSQVMTEAELQSADLQALAYPLVVKPIDESGSVAVRLCRGPADVEQALSQFGQHQVNLRRYRPVRAMLVEEYVDGDEYSCELLWDRQREEWSVVGITRKILAPPPYFVEAGHVFPAELPSDLAEKIEARVLMWLQALGLRCAAAHIELRVRDGEPCLIEVNPRLAGGFITKLVLWTTGIDMVEHYLAYHLREGRPAPDQPPRHGSAAIRFVLSSQLQSIAQAHRIDGLLPGLPGVVQHKLKVAADPRNAPARSNYDRLGYVLLGTAPGQAIQPSLDALDELFNSTLQTEEA
ncbi:ATP-grasp domain-containing protein [Ideonella sp.]|uniref:ATP-grasp domain-containing protein n=1 Tax=Ideonella sp. TaxID=1929293 RepID=UPI0035B04B7C